MKRLAIGFCLAALVAVAGCGSNNNSTAPSNTKVFTVQLNPANEVPPVTDAESSGRATAVVTVHSDTNTIDFSINMNSFPAGTRIIAAHIHGPAAVGVNAGVKVDTGLAATGGVTLSNGSGTFTNSVPTTAQNVTDILGAPQNFYVNIHSTNHGAGVARAQLQ